MDPDQVTEQKSIVIETPGVRREVTVERSDSRPAESSISSGMVALIGVFAIAVIGIVVYLVTNRNTNEAANRNANIEAASQALPSQAPATTIVQQPAAAPQQAPIIIEQPAQQAPVVIQQPAPAQNTGASDDAAMQEAATKKLLQDPEMGSISATVTGSQIVLTGSAASQAIKDRAEKLVRDMRGVRSVDNKILVLGE